MGIEPGNLQHQLTANTNIIKYFKKTKIESFRISIFNKKKLEKNNVSMGIEPGASEIFSITDRLL